mmetsp:Transcript_27797/g.64498  ORF Transcript_27797/g.64498 Transcript_27797/m.64498 type:complete len:212 (+) Transcript_27797:653-1288(+)
MWCLGRRAASQHRLRCRRSTGPTASPYTAAINMTMLAPPCRAGTSTGTALPTCLLERCRGETAAPTLLMPEWCMWCLGSRLPSLNPGAVASASVGHSQSPRGSLPTALNMAPVPTTAPGGLLTSTTRARLATGSSPPRVPPRRTSRFISSSSGSTARTLCPSTRAGRSRGARTTMCRTLNRLRRCKEAARKRGSGSLQGLASCSCASCLTR